MFFYDQIIDRAEELATKFSRDARAIVDGMGIFRMEFPMGFTPHSTCGFCSLYEGNPIIVVNSELTTTHKKFVTGHELYHIENDQFLLENNSCIRDTFQNLSDSAELNANLFAIELLISDENALNAIQEQNSVDFAAMELGIKPSLLAYKLRLLRYKGYPIPEQLTELDERAAAKLL